MGNETNSSKRWHLDKRISLGHLGTTFVVVITFMLWAMSLDTDIKLNTNQIGFNSVTINRVDSTVSAQYAEIIRRLENLDKQIRRQ